MMHVPVREDATVGDQLSEGRRGPVSLPEMVLAAAETEPERVVLREIETGRAFTFSDVAQLGAAWAAGLKSVGVGRGDPIASMFPNNASGQLGWLSASWLGAIEFPINHAYPSPWIERIVRQSGARVGMIAEEFLPLWRPLLTSGAIDRLIIFGGVDQAEILSASGEREVLPLDDSGLTPVRADRYDVSCVIQTSGTTGPSKGVVVPWGQWEARAVSPNIPAQYRTREAVFYSPLPVFHTGGRVYFYDAVRQRSVIVTKERFRTDEWLDDIRRESCSGTILMGAMASFIHHSNVRSDDGDSPLRHVLMAPVPHWIDQFISRFGVEVGTCFSASEYPYPVVAGDGMRVSSRSGGSCGVADPAYGVRLVDADGSEVDVGEPGELLVQSPPWSSFLGYWRQPEESEAAWQGGWFHTGDILKRDLEGRFYFVDRLKDMIRRRSENVSSLEVEEAVLAHPEVEAVAAFGVPADHGEEEVMIAVAVASGSTLEPALLHEFVAKRLPRFAIPTYIEFMESLPTNHTGKTLKRELKARGVTSAAWIAGAKQSTYDSDTYVSDREGIDSL